MICDVQVDLWNLQADKFGSFSSDESVPEEIVTPLLIERKGELEKYHMVMLRGVNNSFATSLKPLLLCPVWTLYVRVVARKFALIIFFVTALDNM